LKERKNKKGGKGKKGGKKFNRRADEMELGEIVRGQHDS